MYKRLLCVILLLTFCISVSVGSYIKIDKISNEIIDDLTLFLSAAEDNRSDDAKEIIKQCNEKLQNCEIYYAIFLEHCTFENLFITVPSVMYLYETNNKDEALVMCFEGIETLKIIINEQKLSVENIF